MKSTTDYKKHTPSAKKVIFPLLAFLLLAAIGALLIFNPFSRNFSDDPNAIEKAADSVVKLNMYDANGILLATGSGFAAFDKDILITNHHCIDGNVYSIEAQRKDGSAFPIDSVVTYDKEKDIAILRAPNCGLIPLKTDAGLDAKQGEKVSAIGSPDGIGSMYSTGVISKAESMGSYTALLSTASISGGSSGGALFNDHGKVIGITSAERIGANDIYLSVPIEYAKALYDNRTPEEEMTVAAWYDQSEHSYTADYLISFGSKLHGQTVTAFGYISGMDADIYLVSAPDLIAFLDARSDFDLTTAMKLRELASSGYALHVDTQRNHVSTKDLSPGDLITVEGTIMYYSASDIRLIADSIIKSE